MVFCNREVMTCRVLTGTADRHHTWRIIPLCNLLTRALTILSNAGSGLGKRLDQASRQHAPAINQDKEQDFEWKGNYGRRQHHHAH